MMKTGEIKILLQRFFDGETSRDEEQALKNYFQSEAVAEELLGYSTFFCGIAELANTSQDSGIEEDIMDFILEQESKEKSRYRWLWQTVTGVAVSILIAFVGILIYEQQNQPFEDTFKNPDEAYVYAKKTLKYMAGEYSSGLAQLSKAGQYNTGLYQLNKLGELEQASKPLSNSLKILNKGFSEMKEIQKLSNINKNE